MVHRTGRPQVVSQLGDHKHSRRATRGDGACLANAGRLEPHGATRAVGGRSVTIDYPAISAQTVLPSGWTSTPHALVRLRTSSRPRPRTRPSGSVERFTGPGKPTGEASRTAIRSPRGPRSSVSPTP